MYHIVGQLRTVAGPDRDFPRELAVAAGGRNSSGVVRQCNGRAGAVALAAADAARAGAGVDPGFQEFIAEPLPKLEGSGELNLNHRDTEAQRRKRIRWRT